MLKNRSKNSFTLIETIVAVFLLTVGIFGTIGLISYLLSSLSITSQKLVAAYLAQEGIEIVRNFRDSNLIQGRNWDAGLNNGDYQADYNDSNLNSYTDTFLKIDGGFYNYDAGVPTIFKRKINLQKSGDLLEIRVTVSWQEKGRSHQLTVQENLYNWR